ncbi:MAG TPA: TetR/AcrR family transcriptional regulator [Mycobacteriales bacterium]
MAADPESNGRSRRTQAERRAATRAALLEATITGLVEHGYAKLTTSHIVESAGVTRGAQAHYFSTKDELVVEALLHLSQQIADDFVAHPPKHATTERGQLAQLLDRWWEVYTGDLFTATAELWIAARTEPELLRHLEVFGRHLTASITEHSAVLAPTVAARPENRAVLTTAMASITGLAFTRFLSGDRIAQRLWSGTRRELLRLVDEEPA